MSHMRDVDGDAKKWVTYNKGSPHISSYMFVIVIVVDPPLSNILEYYIPYKINKIPHFYRS